MKHATMTTSSSCLHSVMVRSMLDSAVHLACGAGGGWWLVRERSGDTCGNVRGR